MRLLSYSPAQYGGKQKAKVVAATEPGILIDYNLEAEEAGQALEAKQMTTSRKSSEGRTPESTWLGRTSFSRSICYRLNSNPRLASLPVPAYDDSKFKGFVKLLGEDPDALASLGSLADGILANRNGSRQNDVDIVNPVSAQSLERVYHASSSVHTSPDKIVKRPLCAHHRSLSLPPKGSRRYRKGEEDSLSSGEFSDTASEFEDGSHRGVARGASWTEYFDTSGNELAVEEAEDWMVDLSDLLLGHKFASGAYSRLYLGKYKGAAVAVKILHKPEDNWEVSKRVDSQFRCEVNALSRVHHRNVVKFVGACKKPPVCCIVTEYLALGSLRSYLHNQQPYALNLKVAVDMALDVAHGMEYLHSQGLIHRDLKSENLIIADDLCVKITDFGVACFEWKPSAMSDDVGTYRWMAPEMISRKHISKKADVYSFGIVLWELLTGSVPFEDLSPVQVAFAVVHKHARLPIPLTCPNPLGRLMDQCWHTDPEKRPDFTKIVGVLEDMQESIAMNRDMSFFHRHHKHTLGLLHCFGGHAAKYML